MVRAGVLRDRQRARTKRAGAACPLWARLHLPFLVLKFSSHRLGRHRTVALASILYFICHLIVPSIFAFRFSDDSRPFHHAPSSPFLLFLGVSMYPSCVNKKRHVCARPVAHIDLHLAHRLSRCLRRHVYPLISVQYSGNDASTSCIHLAHLLFRFACVGHRSSHLSFLVLLANDGVASRQRVRDNALQLPPTPASFSTKITDYRRWDTLGLAFIVGVRARATGGQGQTYERRITTDDCKSALWRQVPGLLAPFFLSNSSPPLFFLCLQCLMPSWSRASFLENLEELTSPQRPQ